MQNYQAVLEETYAQFNDLDTGEMKLRLISLNLRRPIRNHLALLS
jgi:hypothetical protein